MASGSNGGNGDVFDVRRVRKLVELMDEHDLAEIVLQQGEQKMKLRRGPEPAAVTGVPMQAVAPAAAPAPAPAPAATPAPAAAPAADAAASGPVIKSPMVGTFYSSPNPESPAFVKVGDQVGPESIICIVEAMKVFNEIPAECSGKIAAVLVQDGDSVEFGQPIFQLEG